VPLRHLVLPLCAAACLAGDGASQNRLQVLQCEDLLARLAERDGEAMGPRAVDRLEVLLRILLRPLDDEDEDGKRSSVHTLRDRSMILVRGETRHQEAAVRAVGHLARVTRQARLQCTLVTLPAAVAAQHGLVPDRVVPADEQAAGTVFKAAQGQKGTLHNLPEAQAVSLRPFLVGAPARDAADRELRVRGEALVLPDEAALLLQVVRGPLADLAPQPRDPVLQVSTVVPLGGGFLTTAVQGEQALVLWARLVDVVDPVAEGPATKSEPRTEPKK
jgi:hypothetical protein